MVKQARFLLSFFPLSPNNLLWWAVNQRAKRNMKPERGAFLFSGFASSKLQLDKEIHVFLQTKAHFPSVCGPHEPGSMAAALTLAPLWNNRAEPGC